MYLLDTPAFSETRRRLMAAGYVRFLQTVPPQMMFTSSVVVGELWKGASGHPDAAQRATLVNWLTQRALQSVSGRILPVSIEVGERWGLISGEAARRGTTLPVADAFIAATALVHGLIVVTRNEDDFRRCGVAVRNPWAE